MELGRAQLPLSRFGVRYGIGSIEDFRNLFQRMATGLGKHKVRYRQEHHEEAAD
jgi:hypothetical protein